MIAASVLPKLKNCRAKECPLQALSWGCAVARTGIGIILIYAAIPKISHPDRFLNTVMMYNMAPSGVNLVFGATIPWLEMLVGISLVMGLYISGSLIIAAGLFTLYAGAISAALHRGSTFDCGCFGDASRSPIGKAALFRSIVLAAASIGLVFYDRTARYRKWRIV